MDPRYIEECCILLESNKITERKRSCERLSHLLDDPEVVSFISEGNSVSWKRLICSIQECLRKDADKIHEDVKKKGTPYGRYSSADVFVQIIKKASKEAPDELNVSNLVGYIIGCMRDSKMEKCYNATFLVILKDHILFNSDCRGRLDSQDWTSLYKFIKGYCKENSYEPLTLRCLMLTIKWGPHCGLPPCVLRQDFDFITESCQLISRSSPRCKQEDVLDIVLHFCGHTVIDNRVSCCRLGEVVFSNFIDLYELNGREAKIKRQLVEFFLLQMRIRHSSTLSTEEHPYTCAAAWPTWRKCVLRMYSLLSREIDCYFLYHHKNGSFFTMDGESETLWDTFTQLFVEVSREILEAPLLDDVMAEYRVVTCSPPKRQKLEVTMEDYINFIQEKKSWLWVHIVCSIAKVYPRLLAEQYLKLLQLLSTLQIESNNYCLIKNIYGCLTVMADRKEFLFSKSIDVEEEKIWKVIGENTLRTFGLNQHKEATEILLQKLIPFKIIDLKTLLKSYISGVLNISVQSIKTMKIALQYMKFSKAEEDIKEQLINSLLKSEGYMDHSYLLHPETAKFLTDLTLRQWPADNDEGRGQEVNNYSDLKYIYCKNLFRTPVVPPIKIDKGELTEETYNVDSEAARTLINILTNFVNDSMFKSAEFLLSIVLLLINVTSYMLRYKMVDEMEVNDCAMIKLIKKIFDCKEVQYCKYHDRNDREIKRLLKCFTILDKIFVFNDHTVVVSKIKDVVPYDLLRNLTITLNDLQEHHRDYTEIKFKLKKAITKALSSFSCISNTTLNQNQQFILQVMATPNYNCSLESDYALLLTFLNTLKYSKPGTIPQSELENILKSVQEVCFAKYHCSKNAIEIINVLNDLYPHIAVTDDEDIKTSSVELLSPFYEKREDFGHEVSLALLNCMQRLCEVDPESKFSRWYNVEIAKYVPDFLCNDYQEVRFKAIETLVAFFRIMSKSKRLEDFHRQEEIFTKIYEKSLKVFEVTGNITEDRRIDEVVSRTASVFQTFVSISLNCNSWTKECIYAMVKLTFKKNLVSDTALQALGMIEQPINNKGPVNAHRRYLEFILERWLSDDYSIDLFPFKMFGFQDKYQFYTKYFEICVPLLIATERKDLIETGKKLGFSEDDIVKKTCPKIFGCALCNDIENAEDLIERNKVLSYCVKVISLNVLRKSLIENLDQLVLCMLGFLTDDEYIREIFGENVIFTSKNLTIPQLKKGLSSVEAFLDEENIITRLSETESRKMEKILLDLKLSMYNVFTADEKMKHFHRYASWINIILDTLGTNSKFEYFFVRDTTHSLINLIQNHQANAEMIIGICKFLNLFLRKILPKFSESFEKSLMFVVNSLKKYAQEKSEITDICIEILHFLIVQNSCHLMSSIEKLDNFPQDSKFNSIRTVHTKIKYANGEASLEDEINFFLQHEDLSNRQDSLVHLRNILSKEKVQLKQLYDKLQDVRGFSEDCEKSLLHRLICILAKISCYGNDNVKFEALKCLGEIGPADLLTLVLQPEIGDTDKKCTPFELFSGHVVPLLNEFVIDSDIKLVQNASDALYIVLNSKEGRKAIESNINFGYGLIDKKYLSPYFPLRRGSTPSSSVTVIIESFIEKINYDELWCPTIYPVHNEWIVKLVTNLLQTFTDKSYLPKLVPICEVAPKFCEHLLPLLINLFFHTNPTNLNELLSKKIDLFFSTHWQCTVHTYSSRYPINVNKKSIKCMLNIVSFVRLQRSIAKDKGRQVDELKLDYLKVAKAAEFCSAHFTALLYSELWCQARIQDIEGDNQYMEYLGSTKLDVIYEKEEEHVGEALQYILRSAYKAVGDLDALPGCGNSFLLKPQFRVEHYKELGNWDQATHFYEMQVSHGVDTARKDLMESLKRCSLYQLPLLCANQPTESQYECLWRLGQWSSESKWTFSSDNSLCSTDYEKYRFYSLKALHDNDICTFADEKKAQSLCVIENLRHTSLESSQNMYSILTQLQALNELENFAEVALTTKNFTSLLDKWKLQDNLIRGNDFHYVEPVMAQRIVMLTDHLKMNTNDELKEYLVSTLLDFTDLARNEGQFRVATRSLENLRCMSDLSDDVKTQIQLMDAQLSWSLNNKVVARHILSKLCKNENVNPRLQSAALKLSGQYMIETFSENRLVIISDYLLKSLSVIKVFQRTPDDYNSILDTYDKIAQFADKEYQQIMAYMNSDFFRRKIVNMEKAKKTASNIHKQSKKITREECKAASIHDKQSNIDKTEINSTKLERDQFLKLALKYYVLNLKHSDKNNIRIFRVMALLLENKTNPAIADVLKETLPSYKYITMLPQLIPHITENNTDMYSEKVNEIVERCAVQHPYHTLPLLLSLANSNKDREFSEPETKTSSNDARVATADSLLDKLKQRKELTQHINRLQQLSRALIELAYYKEECTNERKKTFDIPRSQKIMKIKNFEDVLLPTYTLPVNVNGNYSNIVGISSFGSEYRPVGGINAPKRITCRGTDGKERSQLLKGHDDLRQDAVMQQVFTIMNNLLAANKQTRHLLIRTYKIVPLSMRSGILEWVDNSMPIGEYLVGDNHKLGAHQLYRPKDKSPSTCREIFKKCAGKSLEHKLQTYKEVCKHLKPVFHKFFETYFPHPTIWYERKRAYIHSVATTSMCGYILGIGDRHVSNIMIDETTAEVIHIDFGIAFEQGRVLPTPETVPFRLTRDIVDGMGVSGVEGLFRRSCEKTMEVLRKNAQTIITILEVLLYDPLYVWTVTAAEANKRQTDDSNLHNLTSDSDDDNTAVNITAERALLRLREKLQGTELGNPRSIEHQVGTLIQQAVDPANLCRLYCGWQPYL